MKFSANLSLLYKELDFLDRFHAAAADGFGGVEFISPYDFPPEQVAAKAHAAGLPVALFNSPAGDWASGDRGTACLSHRADEFKAGIEQAITYTQALDCRQIHVLAGTIPPGSDPALAEATLITSLRHAAIRFAAHGIKALLEPINPVDMPGYSLSSLAQAERVLAAVDHPNLWLQFDAYHMAMTGEDIASAFTRLRARIAHVQIADCPGRHEPGTGNIDYPGFLSTLKTQAYQGWIGAEYQPKSSTSAGLGWLRAAQSL